LILGKIIKIVATRCHILKLKCTKFDFGWAPPQTPLGGAYSVPPYLLAGFNGGLLLKEGRGGRTGEKKSKGEEERRGPTSKARGRGGEGGKLLPGAEGDGRPCQQQPQVCKAGAEGGHVRAGSARVSLGERGGGWCPGRGDRCPGLGDRSPAARKPVCFIARTCDRRSDNCDRKDLISSSACFRSCVYTYTNTATEA